MTKYDIFEKIPELDHEYWSFPSTLKQLARYVSRRYMMLDFKNLYVESIILTLNHKRLSINHVLEFCTANFIYNIKCDTQIIIYLCEWNEILINWSNLYSKTLHDFELFLLIFWVLYVFFLCKNWKKKYSLLNNEWWIMN